MIITMRRRTLLFQATLLLASCFVAFSCDKPKPPAAVQDQTVPIPQLQVDALAQLLPNRPTHLAVDTIGNLYWSQESDDGRDVMYVLGIGADEVPRATVLSSEAILDAMPPVKLPEKPAAKSPAKPQANPATRKGPPGSDAISRGGNIQSIASGIDGELYFYFAGGVGSVTRCCLGRFEPRKGQIRILCDAPKLASASGMGLSISLARGRVMVAGQRVRLLLRHSDGWAMFEFDSHRIPVSGSPELGASDDARGQRRARAGPHE
jgi:hypothetical protein